MLIYLYVNLLVHKSLTYMSKNYIRIEYFLLLCTRQDPISSEFQTKIHDT